jgi:hypothetical protein
MLMFRISSKATAAALFLVAAAVPIGIWVVMLAVPEPDLGFWDYAFSEANEHRWFFIVITVSGITSLAAGITVALTRRRAVLTSALATSILQVLVLGVSGAWLLALFAGVPALWLYRARHEV